MEAGDLYNRIRLLVGPTEGHCMSGRRVWICFSDEA